MNKVIIIFIIGFLCTVANLVASFSYWVNYYGWFLIVILGISQEISLKFSYLLTFYCRIAKETI